MPFCSRCGKEVSEDVSFCPKCGKRLKTGDKSETQTRKRSRVASFFVGLMLVAFFCVVLFSIEYTSIPSETRVQMAYVEHYSELPHWLQLDLARQEGKTVEEMLASPYHWWAPKVSIGLLSAYGLGWVIYLASRSSKTSVEKGENSRTASK